ncbi:hypothetical protein, partial [Treponema sp.]|uniref:hypothetical protein n=1 Tax=Treponema sp. TaxID=166 RepID=UPI003FA1BD4C
SPPPPPPSFEKIQRIYSVPTQIPILNVSKIRLRLEFAMLLVYTVYFQKRWREKYQYRIRLFSFLLPNISILGFALELGDSQSVSPVAVTDRISVKINDTRF